MKEPTLKQMADEINAYYKANGIRSQWSIVGRTILWLDYPFVMDDEDNGNEQICVEKESASSLKKCYLSVKKDV